MHGVARRRRGSSILAPLVEAGEATVGAQSLGLVCPPAPKGSIRHGRFDLLCPLSCKRGHRCVGHDSPVRPDLGGAVLVLPVGPSPDLRTRQQSWAGIDVAQGMQVLL